MGNIFNIQKFTVHDGPGIRTTVFFKGCNLRCAWCHNPESQSVQKQLLIYKDRCTRCGKCREVCPNKLEKCDFCGRCVLTCPNEARQIFGKEMTVDEVFLEVIKDKAFYNSSNGGVTCSGGECMLQIDFLKAILKKCEENSIHTAVDTAGDVPWSSFEGILDDTDLFLYDIKVFDSDLHQKYTGVGNERILQNLKHLFEKQKQVWIRIPIIPGVNDNEQNIIQTMDFLKPYRPQKVELLPYHKMGENKYPALGKSVPAFCVPDEEIISTLTAIVNQYMTK